MKWDSLFFCDSLYVFSIQFDPDFFSKRPLSSDAPALAEEGVSVGNTTAFHSSGLKKNIQM